MRFEEQLVDPATDIKDRSDRNGAYDDKKLHIVSIGATYETGITYRKINRAYSQSHL